MTQKEINLEMQKLKLEYQRKSNKIGRLKNDENAKKQDLILKADDDYHAQKRILLDKINKIRTEKASLFDGDPRRAMLEAEARNIESELSVLRDDNEQAKRRIIHESYANSRALDEQSRLTSEWYEEEKANLMKKYTRDGYLQ